MLAVPMTLAVAATPTSGRLSWTPTGYNASTWRSSKLDHDNWFRNCQADGDCNPYFEPFQKYLPRFHQNCTISDLIVASVDIRLQLATGEPAPGLDGPDDSLVYPRFQHFKQTKCGSGHIITHKGACIWHNESHVALPVWHNTTNATTTNTTNATVPFVGYYLLVANTSDTKECSFSDGEWGASATMTRAYPPPSPPPGGGTKRSQLLTACLLDPGRLAVECYQRDGLLAFFDATFGNAWPWNKNSWVTPWSWDEKDFPCDGESSNFNTWQGVMCGGFDDTLSRNLHVTGLSLSRDTFSSNSCGSFSSMVPASCPPMSGTIPAALAMITTLTSLKLTQSHISGTLPLALGRLTNLKALNLGSNRISGSLPTQLGRFTALGTGLGDRSLELGGNRWSGTIPETIGRLRNLKTLTFNDLDGPSSGTAHLSGTLPATMSNMSSLQVLHLLHAALALALALAPAPALAPSLALTLTMTLLQELTISGMPRISGTIPEGLHLDEPVARDANNNNNNYTQPRDATQNIFFDDATLKLDQAPLLSGTMPSRLFDESYAAECSIAALVISM